MASRPMLDITKDIQSLTTFATRREREAGSNCSMSEIIEWLLK
jgi:hypothetical protein